MRYLKYASGLKSSVVINIDLTISVKLSFLYIRSVVETEHARHKKTEKGGRKGIGGIAHNHYKELCSLHCRGKTYLRKKWSTKGGEF